MFRIEDPNLAPRHRVVAETPYTDVAEILGLGYTKIRYEDRRVKDGIKPVEVIDSDSNKVMYRYGFVSRPVIGKLRR